MNFRTKSILHVIYGIICKCWNFLKMKNNFMASKDLQLLFQLFTMEWDVFLLRQRMDPSLYYFDMRTYGTNSIFSGVRNMCLKGDIQVSHN